MKHIKIFILALISCITLTSCPSDGNDDIVPKDPTEEGTGGNTGGNNGDNTGGSNSSNIEDLHNGTSNKPAYIPQH